MTSPTYVKAAHATGTTALSVTVTFSPTTAGDAITVFVQYNSNSPPTQGLVTVTDNATGGSSTYTSPIGAFLASGNNAYWMFYCSSVKSGVTSITATISSGTLTFSIIHVEEFSSFTGYTFDVAKVAATGTSSATDGWTTGNMTTTAASDWMWAYITAFNGTGTFTVGTSETVADNSTPTFNISESKVVGAAGSYASTVTNTSATDSGIALSMAFSPPGRKCSSLSLLGVGCGIWAAKKIEENPILSRRRLMSLGVGE